jgi:hypothetical protein
MQRGADTKELKLVHPLKDDDHGAVEYSTNLLQNVRASSSVRSERSPSSKENLLRALEANTNANVVSIARKLIDALGPRVAEIQFSSGKKGERGSFLYDTEDPPLFSILGKGQIGFPMRQLHRRFPFDNESKRVEFRRRLETIPGFEIRGGGMEGFPVINLMSLDDKDIDRLIAVLNWEVDQFNIGDDSTTGQ